MAPDGLHDKKLRFVVCYKLVSLLTELSTLSQEIDQIYVGNYVYVADCNYKGNILKPYLPENKTVVVLKCLSVCRHPT